MKKIIFIEGGSVYAPSDVMVKEVKRTSEVRVFCKGKELRRVSSE